jgi:hypothetical protein
MELAIKPKTLSKLITFLDLIESVDIKDNTAYIKTKFNVVLENEGHIVTINKGLNVTIAEEVHLNPLKPSDLNKITDSEVLNKAKEAIECHQ